MLMLTTELNIYMLGTLPLDYASIYPTLCIVIAEDITDELLWNCIFNEGTIKLHHICGMNKFIYLFWQLINNLFCEILSYYCWYGAIGLCVIILE